MCIAYLYWRFGSGITGDDLKAFKGSVSAVMQNFAINPIAGLVVLTFFMSMPAFSRFKHLIWALLALFIPVLVITGARTTILAVPLAALLFCSIRYLSRRQTLALLVSIGLVLALLLALAAGVRVPATAVDDLDGVTTHRGYMWTAAWDRFSTYPWLGAGADTRRTDLPTFLPQTQEHWISDSILQLTSGAYHNAYLTYAAERGLIVFLPALLSTPLCFAPILIGSCLPRPICAFATIAPFIVLFILVRQVAESSGLLGYANGATDFACFAVASLVVATSCRP